MADIKTLLDDTHLPSYKRPEARKVEPDLLLMQHLLAGTRTMQAEASAQEYIRKWTDEEASTYLLRCSMENVFEGVGRTLSAGIGMIFSKPPQIQWNEGEEQIKLHWQNIDGAGTAGNVFTKRFGELGVRDGVAAILIDHTPRPPAPAGEALPRYDQTLAANSQPRWSAYARANILNWRTAVVNNQTVFTLLVFAENAEIGDGEYGISSEPRYRVLRLIPGGTGGKLQAVWQVYKIVETPNGATSQLVGSGVFRNARGETRDTLPVRLAYCGRTEGAVQATIPLLGVAWANLSHWRRSTDLAFYNSLCAYPQPKLVGRLVADPTRAAAGMPTTIGLGPLVTVHVEEGGDFGWAELQGSSIQVLERGVKEKLAQIAQQGMSFLLPDTRAAETAEAKRLDATAENATLATAATGIEDCINGAFEDHAWYLGIEKSSEEGKGAPVITLNRDYENLAMDAQTMQAYTALVASGFPKLIVLQALQQGGRIPADADLIDLANEWDANETAKAEAAALEQQMNAELNDLALEDDDAEEPLFEDEEEE